MEDNQNKGMARGCLTLGLAAIALVVLIIFLLSIGGGKDTAKPASTGAPAAAAATPMPIDDVVSAISAQTDEKFDKSSVFVQDKIIVAQVWMSGTTEIAMTAVSNESLADQWADMVESMRKTSEQTKDAIDQSGNTEYHIAYYLMNDQNDENFLVSTLDDTLMYDAVSGVNLLGVEK